MKVLIALLLLTTSAFADNLPIGAVIVTHAKRLPKGYVEADGKPYPCAIFRELCAKANPAFISDENFSIDLRNTANIKYMIKAY